LVHTPAKLPARYDEPRAANMAMAGMPSEPAKIYAKPVTKMDISA
jgi:hypothetical protein